MISLLKTDVVKPIFKNIIDLFLIYLCTCLAEYVHTKKILPKKYLSPYLEQFNLSVLLKYENDKINLHNLNLKNQRKREKIEEDIIRKRKKIQV